MPPTLTNNLWLYNAVARDLQSQGGLSGVITHPVVNQPSNCSGEYRGLVFNANSSFPNGVTLKLHNTTSRHLLNSALVRAFTKVIDYPPFCCYLEGGSVYYLWEQDDPHGTFEYLKSRPTVTNLVSLALLQLEQVGNPGCGYGTDHVCYALRPPIHETKKGRAGKRIIYPYFVCNQIMSPTFAALDRIANNDMVNVDPLDSRPWCPLGVLANSKLLPGQVEYP